MDDARLILIITPEHFGEKLFGKNNSLNTNIVCFEVSIIQEVIIPTSHNVMTMAMKRIRKGISIILKNFLVKTIQQITPQCNPTHTDFYALLKGFPGQTDLVAVSVFACRKVYHP
jgi:hypothetical protein